MTISYNWLCDYLGQGYTPERISEILTSVGLEVESMEKVETVRGGLEGLWIGRVEECVPHPNADKLRITKVNIGKEELLHIVCGAPNVAVGQHVVVAVIGTTIYPTQGEPFEIKKAKIRGEESQGMICAEDEIGLGESHDGIIVLPDTATIGQSAREYYQLGEADYVYEIGLTPNHMDAMSHMGCVKNICAYLTNETGQLVVQKVPTVNLPSIQGDVSTISIQLEDITRCARYAGMVLHNISVAPSPEWLQTKLKNIGVRPINNVVDITNFVLHECGQPLHAFDLAAIKGNKVVVRTANEGERLICLDEKERQLSSEDLLICNESEPMCIAGVFGGFHSGVSEQTHSIFLESAWFEPESIRKTSMRHGLRTDAATRFEKGADISQVEYALQRAASLLCELTGATIGSAVIEQYPIPKVATEIDITYERIRNLAGKAYPASQIQQILRSLCFSILEQHEAGIKVAVPFAKPDITMAADIVEEIMRIDGLDNISLSGGIHFTLPETDKGFRGDVKRQIAQQLVAKGFYELFTNSITNAAYYPEQEGLVTMMNSLSANLDIMRPSMLETGLEAIAYNLNRKNKQLKFFEFGRVYHQHELKFTETDQLALYVSGTYQAAHWNTPAKEADIYFIKGIVDGLLEIMKLSFAPNEGEIQILFRNKMIGKIIQVDAARLKQFDIKQAVWFVELDWNTIRNFYENYQPVYKEIPKFPVMQRDLALILDKHIQYQDVQTAVKQAKSKLLQDVQLFDVFENEKLGAGKKSYAINLSFYHAEKTLTDTEVETEMSLIVKSLEQKLGAAIRGN